LLCTVITPSTDPDGDAITYIYQWYKDGVLEQELPTNVVPAASTTKGDIWMCVVTPNDGSENGLSSQGQVTIQNGQPTAPMADVTPDMPLATDDIVCSITTPSADPDGDSLTYIYQWYKNGVLEPELITNVVPAASTTEGDIWRCVVAANDGTVSGLSGEDEVAIQNSPASPPINLLPADGATCVSLTPTLGSSAFSDPDAGDTHAASQWQITAAAGNYSSLVFDSGIDISNLIDITIAPGVLNSSTAYYWHIKHQDNRGGWSSWSAETSFTTTSVGICGDVAPCPDCDGIVNMGDVVLLLNYVGHPGEYQLCCEWAGDVAPCPASDGVINMGDVVLLLNYVGHPGDYQICCHCCDRYELTISNTSGGSVTMPGEGTFTYDEGTVVNLVAEAQEGYGFVNWTGDVGTIGSVESSMTTIIMNDNYSITAEFEAIPTTVFTYSGTGELTTPPFEVSSSPWKLCFMANWDGHFAVQVINGGIELVINRSVVAGEVYETYVYDHIGSLHFEVTSAPADGEWTLSVIENP